MMDIMFSDSACGSFKMAQNYGKGEYQEGCIGVIISHADGSKPTKMELETARLEANEKARSAWESSTPLGGKTADIFGFNLALSVGDISEYQPGNKRKQLLERLFSIYPNAEGNRIVDEILKSANENLEIVCKRAEMGEDIRIWYSNQPDEMCGLYWFMEQMNQLQISGEQILIIKLPEWEVDKKGNSIQRNSWSEVAPEEWRQYLAMQKVVLPSFIQSCASHWKELKKENAPLRAILNGHLISMSDNLYDDFIIREIEAEGEEFLEAMIIGRVVGKYHLGIGDFWIAFRIEEMIRTGKLEVVTASDKDMPRYHRWLKKCDDLRWD